MFYCTDEQFGLTFDAVRKLFPHRSFPASGVISSEPVRSYTPSSTPGYNPVTHAVHEVAPVDGVQQWEVHPLPLEQVHENQQAALFAGRETAKAQRQEAVGAIRVTTTAGNTFDGDETSQARMVRAVVALQAAGAPSVTWVLADNSVIDATVAELTEALILAGAAQAAVWVIEQPEGAT